MTTQVPLQVNEHLTQSEPKTIPSMGRILVALDYSPLSQEVFQKALAIAQSQSGRLMVFHSMQHEVPTPIPLSGAVPFSVYNDYSRHVLENTEHQWQEAVDRVQAWLSRYCQAAQEVNVPAEYDYAETSAGPRICELAGSWKADLVVVGRRGNQGIAEMLMGSVSNYVVHHAPCSVLVIQHG